MSLPNRDVIEEEIIPISVSRCMCFHTSTIFWCDMLQSWSKKFGPLISPLISLFNMAYRATVSGYYKYKLNATTKSC